MSSNDDYYAEEKRLEAEHTKRRDTFAAIGGFAGAILGLLCGGWGGLAIGWFVGLFIGVMFAGE